MFKKIEKSVCQSDIGSFGNIVCIFLEIHVNEKVCENAYRPYVLGNL